MSLLRHTTLGCAIMEAQRKVREEGGPNAGPRVKEYLKNVDPPIHAAAPWCAAFVQFCADVASRALALPNPLDDVKQEALVQSYHNWASDRGLVVPGAGVNAGDLVLFRFGGQRWDHIGIVLEPPASSVSTFRTIEGNTNDAGSREGDGVFVKVRKPDLLNVAFVRWAA